MILVHVAIITAMLSKAATNNTHLWIGYNSITESTKWEWANNAPIRFTNWNEGEPNNQYQVYPRYE